MIEQLTKSQKKVLEQAMRGDSNNEIASKLQVRKGTVDKHFYNITKHLGIRNKLVAVLAYADEKSFLERQKTYTQMEIDE